MTVAATTHPPQASEDFFSTLMPWMLILLLLAPFLALFVGLVAMYVGVEYSTPPWNAHSVPPPQFF